jgi:hypothetical protein
MYTHSEEKPLAEVMRNIAKKENNGPALSHKEDNAKLIAYFKEVLPDYDEDRVYPSDIKKVLNWYNVLQSKGLVSSEEPTKAKTSKAEAAESAEETPAEKKPAAKKAKKK